MPYKGSYKLAEFSAGTLYKAYAKANPGESSIFLSTMASILVAIVEVLCTLTGGKVS